MKSVCCSNMPYAREAFSNLGEVLVKDGREITPLDVRDATILAIRSTIKVNKALLNGSCVKFVGTATIGTDHMDTAWLDNAGIKWCYAPGCNANSVSEYIVSALLFLANRHGFALEGKTIGVIGVGNVGSRVVSKAHALGMRILQNDPPRARRERSSKSQFVSLDRVLTESDIVTMHVPMTKEGRNATYHMADEKFFGKMKRGCIFINAARGAVIVTDALLSAMDKGIVSHTVIDTWEGEPVYRTDLLRKADIVTPHIAGHSFEGKVAGTVMIYKEACQFLGSDPTWTVDNLLPPPLVPEVEVDASGSDDAVLWEIVRRVYDIEADDHRMRESCVPDDKKRSANFDALRRNYPVRREFPYTRVVLKNASEKLTRKVASLGFAPAS
jgi:erythronate-4-phosphate dehydrogenase